MLPVFYINLASRPDRRAFMEDQFATLGIAAERIEATRPDEVPAEVLAIHADPRRRWALTTPENACNQSHRQIWNIVVERDLPGAVVLEDDVMLAPNFADFTDAALLERLGADLVKLETWGNPVWLGGRPVTLSPGVVSRQLLSPHLGAGAYIISRKLVERSLADPVSLEMIVDHYFFGHLSPHLMMTNIQQISPAPGIQLGQHELAQNDARSRSDLADWRSGIRKIRDPWWRRWRNRFAYRTAGLRFRLRLAAWALRHPPATLPRQDVIPFADDL